MRSVLVSTYEMGRQPFGVASAAAWLGADGWDVACVDTAKETLRPEIFDDAELIGFHLPMHTATRLAAPIIATARQRNAAARIAAFGLYAPLNDEWLRSHGVDAIFGGEFEQDLSAYAQTTTKMEPQSTQSSPRKELSAVLAVSAVKQQAKLRFLVPDRRGLPPLSKYASLQMPDGTRKVVGYTEASRGCLHLCRHCPIVPVYNGQFRIVQPEVVLADIAAQVRAGARHITFGDPDFFNGPTHARRLVEQLHDAHPGVTYDVTIKVEHLIRHYDLLPKLAETGCAFVTSAVESIDDQVLALLDKGHTRADFVDAVALCRAAGVALVPTFVAFHPWLTLEDYCDLLDTIEELQLVEHVAPIQLAIRLLVPEGSRLLERPEMRAHTGRFDPATLTYRWTHPDARVDALHQEVSALVGTKLAADRRAAFDRISDIAHERAGIPRRIHTRPERARATVPYLNEPWYC